MPLSEADRNEVLELIQAQSKAAADAAQKTVGELVQKALGEALAPLNEQVKALDGKLASIQQPDAAALAEQVTQQVTIKFQEAKKAQDAAESKAAKRAEYIKGKAPRLPQQYWTLVPDTDEASQLDAAIQAATERFTADIAAAGGQKPSVGAGGAGDTDAAAAAAAQAAARTEGLSPVQKIAAGLKSK